MRNHKLVDDTMVFLYDHKNNNYYIDDIYEIINNNEFGSENSSDLSEILNILSDRSVNAFATLNGRLQVPLYRIMGRNNGLFVFNKLNCIFQ